MNLDVRFFLRIATFLILISGWRGAVAQTEPCARLTVSASITNRDWAPISGLQPDDFVAAYRGKPDQILSVTPDNRPRRIVILLDSSGSLQENKSMGVASVGPWRLAINLASHIVEFNLEQTQFALIIFNEKIREKMDFESGQKKIAERLRQIGTDPKYEKTNVKGKTALWDAAAEALKLLEKSDQNGVIYAITDGADNLSSIKEKELRYRLSQGHVRFFASMLAAQIVNRGRTPEEISGPESLSEMVSNSGGIVFGPVVQTRFGVALAGTYSTPELKVADALGNFYRAMQYGYRVQLELPEARDRWSSLKLDLSKPARSRFKGYQFGFTRDIPPCEADSQ